MGLYIPGLELPVTGNISITIFADGLVSSRYTGNVFPDRAVSIPLHGRIGDLDALMNQVADKYFEHERKGELVFAAAEIKQDICDLITAAPSIIPAEESEL